MSTTHITQVMDLNENWMTRGHQRRGRRQLQRHTMSTRRQHEHQLVVTVLRVRREGQAAACLSAASRDSPARPRKLTVAQLPGLLHPLRAPPTPTQAPCLPLPLVAWWRLLLDEMPSRVKMEKKKIPTWVLTGQNHAK